MKQFAVIGIGSFGLHVARRLAEGGAEVLAVDVRSDRIDAIKDVVTQAVIADATDAEALAELIPEDLDGVVVCVGENVEGSIMVCLHLKELGCDNLIAKAQSEDHAKVLKALGVGQTVHPERERAERLAESLVDPNFLDHLPLPRGYRIAQLAPPETLRGKTVAEAALRAEYGLQILAVKRGQRIDLVPRPEDVLGEEDQLVVVGRDEDIRRLTDL